MDPDDQVFKALADPTRRFLLDQLQGRDGQALTELESVVDMSRFGVMKHLRVLEEAGLVVSRRSGREKLHFLNAVPIRLIHDRWIDRYTEPRAAALARLKADLEGMPMTTPSRPATTQVFRVHIKAEPDPVWTAITSPDWSARYGYGPVDYELRPGGRMHGRAGPAMRAMGVPDTLTEGEVVEVDPPRRLVHTYRLVFDAEVRAEPVSTVTWELEPLPGGVTRLTVIHELAGAPAHARLVSGEQVEAGGGWPYVLSDLKSLLETGAALVPQP